MVHPVKLGLNGVGANPPNSWYHFVRLSSVRCFPITDVLLSLITSGVNRCPKRLTICNLDALQDAYDASLKS